MLESALLFTSHHVPAKTLKPLPKSHFRSNCGWKSASRNVPFCQTSWPYDMKFVSMFMIRLPDR